MANGNYKRFMHLIAAATTGLIKQIPVVGPMLQSVLDQLDKENLVAEMQRLSRLLEAGANLTTAKISAEQMEHDLSVIVKDENSPRLASAVLLAEAEAGNHFAGEHLPPAAGGGEAGNHLAGRVRQQGRFLYLASDDFADHTRTAQIAANLGFLWRPYHADGGARVAHVGDIRVGDLIALAYRSPNHFRLLLPLVVTAAGDHTLPINDAQCPKQAHAPHAPFVLADPWLTQILVQECYTPDPIFNAHSGLNVNLLLAQAPQQMFPSPGQNTIWPYLQINEDTGDYYLPTEVRNWIGHL